MARRRRIKMPLPSPNLLSKIRINFICSIGLWLSHQKRIRLRQSEKRKSLADRKKRRWPVWVAATCA